MTNDKSASPKKHLPAIHWLMVAAAVVMALVGAAVTWHISHEIDSNTSHNEAVLERSRHIETEAGLILDQILPAFKSLHSLNIAITRHIAAFKLYVLDSDRDAGTLAQSLVELEKTFASIPLEPHRSTTVDRESLEEIVGVFADITHEALEIRSPNQLIQLLSDSEDVFAEFSQQLDETRRRLEKTVSAASAGIAQDLRDSRASVTIQQRLLKNLDTVSITGLSLLITFVLLVSFLLFRSLHRRLGTVAKYAQGIAEGKYSASIDFSSSDRIGEMAQSVSHMGSTMAALVEESRSQANSAKHAARTARRLAYYDSLTGLPNRQQFIDNLESAIEESGHIGERVAVVYMDLDKFKNVNDSYGHSTGDKLLCAVADRLTHSMREGDAIARNTGEPPAVLPSRLGGDEFTFLINRLHNRDEAESITGRILRILAEPYHLDGREVIVTPSMGVAIFPENGRTVTALMKNADMAMYQAKEDGRNNVKFFSKEIGDQHIKKLGLERDLDKALESEELSVHYQAKVDLNTRQIVGAEALLRWDHPRRGMISPLEFIPVAEETGAIISIGEWVLKQACEQLVQWQSGNIDPVPIAVNVSAKQLARGDLLSVVSKCISLADICVGNIELELTESTLMNDTAHAVDVLSQMKEAGIRVSLDDFGTGYSSLSYLKRFPLKTLKIDRSFVRDVETDVDDATIIKAILALSRSLGLKVIAEGVENEQQASFLRMNGCQEAQGYLFSKPLPAEEFTRLLMNRGAVSVA